MAGVAMSHGPRRVAVLIEASNAYARGLLAGIHRHMREHEPWTVFLPEHGRGAPPLGRLAHWQGDGIVARIETAAIARAVDQLRRERRLPVVDVSAARLIADVPYVETDDAAIARLAAAHFAERGFRRFAFLGDDRFRWSTNREEAFAAAVVALGHSIQVFAPRGRRAAAAAGDDDAQIEAWLTGLEKPVALFACYDVRGRQALDACRRAAIAVPDEVAVLGVDDDEVLCELASPPLSSIVPDAVGAGREAAVILDRLMDGGAAGGTEWLLEPLGITTRRSTDVVAIDEPLVAAAMRYIRDHAERGIKATDVARALGISRRVLETRFARRVGHTPHDEIARVQMRLVEGLLRETDLPLATIAARAGFRHPEYLTVAFTRHHGTPPSRWRRQFRGDR
jgi:LacI family transcriptional regulator